MFNKTMFQTISNVAISAITTCVIILYQCARSRRTRSVRSGKFVGTMHSSDSKRTIRPFDDRRFTVHIDQYGAMSATSPRSGARPRGDPVTPLSFIAHPAPALTRTGKRRFTGLEFAGSVRYCGSRSFTSPMPQSAKLDHTAMLK